MIGTSKSTVSRLESGDREPSAEMVRRIVAATDGEVSPNDLFLPLQPEKVAS